MAKEGDPGFSPSSDRNAPYNVMLDVAELAGTLEHSPPADAYLLAQGKRYDATWSKSTASAPWTFQYTADSAGHAFAVPAGRTWLALLPDEGATISTT